MRLLSYLILDVEEPCVDGRKKESAFFNCIFGVDVLTVTPQIRDDVR